MKINLRQLSSLEFRQYFADAKGVLDYYIKHMYVHGGFVLAAFVDNAAVGVVLLDFEAERPSWAINYIYVIKAMRGKGIGSYIISNVQHFLCPPAKRIYTRVVDGHKNANKAKKIFEASGFCEHSKASIYTSHITKERLFELGMQVRGMWKGIFSRLENAGYQYCRFSDLSTEQLQSFLQKIDDEFPVLREAYVSLVDPLDKLDLNKSVLAMIDNRPAAFCMISRLGDSFVVQQVALAFRDSGKGLLVALCGALADALMDSAPFDLIFTIYEENETPANLRDRVLLSIIDSEATQINYLKVLSSEE